MVGHDDTRPEGEQDAMMLNGTTLAYGDARDPQHPKVAKVQTLPGVGPMDDGSHWVVRDAVAVKPLAQSHSKWVWGGVLAALAAALGIGGGVLWRRRRLAPAADFSEAVTGKYDSDPFGPTKWLESPYDDKDDAGGW